MKLGKYFSEEEVGLDPILKWLEPNPKLPPEVSWIPMATAELARRMVDSVPRNPERTVGLRHLLDAKDALVRAALD